VLRNIQPEWAPCGLPPGPLGGGRAVPNAFRTTGLRWIVCGLLFLVTTVNYMDRAALGLVEPLLKHLLGGDQDPALYNRHYSEIVNCFIFAYGVGLLFAGRIIDRVGARLGLAVAILAWALASLSHTMMRSVAGFGIARFALGLGEAGNFPAALKATADWFGPEERALATGIFNSGTSAASLMAPVLIPWVALRYGWQAAFFTTGGLSLLWLCCWMLFPYDRLRQRYGEPSSSIPAGEQTSRASFLSLLSSRGTWAFAGSKALTDPVWWFYLFWLPKFFHERFGVEMSRLGVPLIIVYVGATAGSIAGGWLAGFAMRRGRCLRSARRLAMMISASATTAIILVPLVHHLNGAIALLCLSTAAHQGWSSNLLSTPSDQFGPESVATVVGIGGAVGSVSSTLFTMAVGILWTRHSLVVFLGAGLAYLLAMALFQRDGFAQGAEMPVRQQTIAG
jgi:MFS transporter, ACS family, hexuronate transporter